MKFKKNRAFSLVEFMAALSIFSIVVGSLYGALAIARISWSSSSASIVLQKEARRALDTITRQLRIASSVTISESGSKIEFDSNSFELESVDPNIDDIIVEEGFTSVSATPQAVVATNVSSLMFTEITADEVVKVEITFAKNTFLNRTITISVVGNVYLRD